MIKICKLCGREFEGNKNRKFCSVQCARKSQAKPKVEYKCDFCSKSIYLVPYVAKDGRKHYCSNECKNKGYALFFSKENHPNWLGNQINFKCEICGNMTSQPKEQFKRSKHHYCSKDCMYKGISNFNKGTERYNYNSDTLKCDVCGKTIIRKKSRVERNQHNYCSSECASIGCSINFRKDKRYNYNYDLSDEEREIRRDFQEYNNFVKRVRQRDNFTCQLTLKVGGNLPVHHLDGYNWCKEKRLDLNNAITLSEEVHKLFHKIYGYGNNTKEQFKEFEINYKNNKLNKLL